jgi:hypothetical protein
LTLVNLEADDPSKVSGSELGGYIPHARRVPDIIAQQELMAVGVLRKHSCSTAKGMSMKDYVDSG